jgi:hypothetical protein
MSVATIEDFLKAYNQTSKPFVWTATAQQIADEIARCRAITRTEHYLDQAPSWVSWIRFPQVSSSMAIVEPVTWVGGIVNAAPQAWIRS